MRTLSVALDERSYPIHIGAGLLQRTAELLPEVRPTRCVIVTNPVVASFHLAALKQALSSAGVRSDSIVVPDGEAHKDWSTLFDVHTRLLELGADRSTWLIALGGGVVGDLAGFAAATYQRGIPLVQIPTTLLAQVDSSVGGKTAVNHPLGKNMIGAFYQPRAVIIDTSTLRTLPEREYVSGLAEVIKYGAIRDANLFAWLETNIARLLERQPEALGHAIVESCRIKSEIVAADEREASVRALLNFGHTFGHAIETATGYGTWLHGEAVAAGMVLAAKLSQDLTGLAATEVERLRQLLERAHLPVEPPPIADERWLELMSRDKKVSSGALRFVLLEALGKATVRTPIDEERLIAVLH